MLYVITYMWNLKNTTNELIQQNRNRLTDIENKLVVTRGEREVGRGKMGVGDKEVQITVYKINKLQGYIV